MKPQPNHSLKNYNSFALTACARRVVLLESMADLQPVLAQIQRSQRHLVLGAGSNVLFVTDFPGLVIINRLCGKQVVEQDDDSALINVAAGENWHEFVRWAIDNGFYGLENLSLIPGTVGAAPVQNIGAYGVELDRFVDHLEAIELSTGHLRVFDNQQCQFAYRESVFKQQPDRFLITSVTFKLNRYFTPELSYAGIRETLKKMNIDPAHPTAKQTSEAICAIRSRKLPTFRQGGNAGSFFKNPIVSADNYHALKAYSSNLPAYPLNRGHFKIPAAWLIEQCGWKGHREGDAGVYAGHALVLINHGNATGRQIWQLAQKIRSSVYHGFGIEIEPEPRIINTP